MDVNEAVNFLRENQPHPDDEELVAKPEIIQKYNQVRRFFLENPDPICIPLFLHSFGNGSGFGIYQLVEDVLIIFDQQEVIPYLVDALDNELCGIKYWCSQIASSFPDERLIEPLAKLLETGNPDIRYAAIISLAEINSEDILRIIKNFRLKEEDTEVLELIKEVLGDLEV